MGSQGGLPVAKSGRLRRNSRRVDRKHSTSHGRTESPEVGCLAHPVPARQLGPKKTCPNRRRYTCPCCWIRFSIGLQPRPGAVLVDGTLGGGGHTRALAAAVGQQGTCDRHRPRPGRHRGRRREASRAAGEAGAGELLRPARGARTTGNRKGRRRAVGSGPIERSVGRPEPGIQFLGRWPVGPAVRSDVGRAGPAD